VLHGGISLSLSLSLSLSHTHTHTHTPHRHISEILKLNFITFLKCTELE
jgi:stage III sporulation protein SpoIIIAA